jgi:hypothetical protein
MDDASLEMYKNSCKDIIKSFAIDLLYEIHKGLLPEEIVSFCDNWIEDRFDLKD